MTSRRVRGLYFMRESSPVQPVVQAEAPACPRVHSLRGLHPKRGHTARPHVASFRPRTHPLCLPPHARADASAPSTLLPPPLHLLALTEARTLALAAHAASLWGSFTLGQFHFGGASRPSASPAVSWLNGRHVRTGSAPVAMRRPTSQVRFAHCVEPRRPPTRSCTHHPSAVTRNISWL